MLVKWSSGVNIVLIITDGSIFKPYRPFTQNNAWQAIKLIHLTALSLTVPITWAANAGPMVHLIFIKRIHFAYWKHLQTVLALHWRHNEHDDVSNHQCDDCEVSHCVVVIDRLHCSFATSKPSHKTWPPPPPPPHTHTHIHTQPPPPPPFPHPTLLRRVLTKREAIRHSILSNTGA